MKLVHLNKKNQFFQYLKSYILLVLIYCFIDTLPHCIYKINVILLKNYLCTQVVCAVSNGTPFNLVIKTKLFTGTHKPNPDLLLFFTINRKKYIYSNIVEGLLT